MFSMVRNTAVSLGAGALALAAGFSAPAQAGYVVTLKQMGLNVVATGSGTIDLDDLDPPQLDQKEASMKPATATSFIATGAPGLQALLAYTGVSGPQNFGPGGLTVADTGTGGLVVINGGNGGLEVPLGFAGGPISDSATYDNATFASLGVTPGTYEWVWGDGLPDQHFTLQIGPAAVTPEPASLSVLALGLAGLLLMRRTRRA